MPSRNLGGFVGVGADACYVTTVPMPRPFAADIPLVPRQIAYLSCDRSRLYTEVIQVLSDRQLCWARPLVLTTPDYTVFLNPNPGFGLPSQSAASDSTSDLEKAPDLLWPMHQFSPALDTDFLELIMATATPTHSRRTLLNQFIHRLWETTSNGA